MPVEPPEEGKIVHPTFQITAFSTSLKNHVMVMDLVKRDWLPSQRRAKVCFIHTCQGLKVAERQVSRCEVQLGGGGGGGGGGQVHTELSDSDGGLCGRPSGHVSFLVLQKQ